jgi:tetratricopeptide (TPR) repeat protein
LRRGLAHLAGLGALFFSLSCVHALKEPPPLSQLGGPQTRSTAPAEVDPLLHQGELLFAQRSLDSVRQAADKYLQAAQADPTRVEGLVGTVQARIWLVDHLPDTQERRAESVLAVQAAQWCLRVASSSAACHYWLGAALGIQARERAATALDALPRIEELFRQAAEIDPLLDEAGPHRALALLYARAPGWPAGPGDPDRALVEAKEAASLRPDYPPNQLALAEAFSKTGARDPARQAYTRALELAKSGPSASDPDAAEWIEEAAKALRGLTPSR